MVSKKRRAALRRVDPERDTVQSAEERPGTVENMIRRVRTWVALQRSHLAVQGLETTAAEEWLAIRVATAMDKALADGLDHDEQARSCRAALLEQLSAVDQSEEDQFRHGTLEGYAAFVWFHLHVKSSLVQATALRKWAMLCHHEHPVGGSCAGYVRPAYTG